jgi:hypothetical protein
VRSGHHRPQRGRGPCRPEGCHSPPGARPGCLTWGCLQRPMRALPPYYSHATRGGSNQHAVSPECWRLPEVLCRLCALWCSACAVCCWEERERAASLPVGRHRCREEAALLPGEEALLPSDIAAGGGVRATGCVCVRACIETLVDADAVVARCVVAHCARRRHPSALRA